MKDAVILMIAGMLIVFSVLIITILLIKVLSVAIGSSKKDKGSKNKKDVPPQEGKKTDNSVNVVAPVQNSQTVSSVSSSDDDEIIAVISAAVAYMSMCDGKQYEVKSVRPAKCTRPVWAVAGVYENTIRF